MPSDNRPLNVLHVCDHLGWEGSRMHGVKRLFGWMIPRFDPARYRVALVSLRKRDLSEETLDQLGIDITYLAKSKFDPTTLPALLKVIDRHKTDILHLHGYGASTFGRIAAALRGIPVVVHEHANLTNTPWFQKVADRALEPYTDLAIAVSQSTADFIVGARLIRPERVKVVYLGAPLEEFGRPKSLDEIADARRSFGVTPGDFLVGTITRLHDSKGNQYLVDAAKNVVDRRPQARFLMFGEGPLLASLQAQAASLGLGDRFIFGGFVKEGTPLTVFESMAAARPIVATDADGLLDVLTDGVNAAIVPKRNAGALADRIVALMDDPGERARLGEGARQAARQYDISAFVRKMEQLYDILHRESRPRRRHVAEALDLSFLTTKAGA
jgi:glycosyltransferase involved in cell wall biosynthesis